MTDPGHQPGHHHRHGSLRPLPALPTDASGIRDRRDFVEVLRRDYAVDISERTLYAMERGEQMPRLDFVIAALAALDIDLAYFYPAVRGDVVNRLKENGG